MLLDSDPSAAHFRKILSCDSYQLVRSHLLEPIATAIGARSAIFVQARVSSPRKYVFGVSCQLGVKTGALDAYVKHFHSQDPVFQYFAGFKNNRSLLNKDVIIRSFVDDKESDVDPDYRANFVRRFGIGHVLAFGVPIPFFDGQVMCLGFHRDFEQLPFSELDVAWFKKLVPALRSTLRLLANRELITSHNAMAGAIHELCAKFGFVVLDDDLIVRFGNVQGFGDLGMHGGGDDSVLLGQLKQRLIQDRCSPIAHFRLESTKHTRSVQVRSFLSAEGGSFFLVLTSGIRTIGAIEDSCCYYELTQRQIEVVQQVASGNSNMCIGESLDMSLRTVENHLRDIYEKVGVKSRTQLLSKLLGI